MTLIELFQKLVKEYSESADVAEKSEGMAALDAFDAYYRADDRIHKLCQLIAKNTDGAKLFEVAQNVLPPQQIGQVTTAMIESRRMFVSNRMSMDSPERNMMMALPRSGAKNVTDKTFAEIDRIAEKYLSPKELEEYRNVSFLDGLPRDYIAKSGDKYAVLFAQEDLMTDDQKDGIVADYEKHVPVQDMADDKRTKPVGNEYLLSIKSGKLTEEESAAIEYIEKNVRVATKEYGSYLDGRNVKMMSLVKKENKELIKQYMEKHPEDKDVFAPGMSGYAVKEGKEKNFDEIVNREFKFSDDAREAMRTIMHIMDDLNTITNDNVCVGEEGSKIYGCAAIFNVTNEIERAMKEGRVKDLPKLTQKYAYVREQTDRMMDIAKEHFANGELNYVDNLDVARNSMFPPEYRSRNRDATCLASLYCSLKICKILGVSIDDYVKEPNRYLNQARKEMLERYDIDRATQGRSVGDKLYLLESPNAGTHTAADLGIMGLCMRAGEGFRSMDKDPECTMHNIGTRIVGSDYFFTNMGASVNQKPLSMNVNETVQNMLLFDDTQKSIYELSASPCYKYNMSTHTASQMLDTTAKIKATEFDYDQLTAKTQNMYNDYMKNCLRFGRFGKEQTVNAIKSLADRIAKVRPEEAEKPEFARYRTYVDKLTATPTIGKIIELGAGDQNLSAQIKGLSLNTLNTEHMRYKNLPLSTRFVSYLPFVNNSATRLRHQISDDKALLKSHGVTSAEISKALDSASEVPAGTVDVALHGLNYNELDVRPEKEIDSSEIFNDLLKEDVEPDKEREVVSQVEKAGMTEMDVEIELNAK